MRRRAPRRPAASRSRTRPSKTPPQPADAPGTQSSQRASTASLARAAGSNHAIPPLQRYGQARTDSGVRAYALLPDAIVVEFANGAVYLYTAASAGPACIERMHRLARMGRGLSTLINRTVRHRYAARLG